MFLALTLKDLLEYGFRVGKNDLEHEVKENTEGLKSSHILA